MCASGALSRGVHPVGNTCVKNKPACPIGQREQGALLPERQELEQRTEECVCIGRITEVRRGNSSIWVLPRVVAGVTSLWRQPNATASGDVVALATPQPGDRARLSPQSAVELDWDLLR
jgi:hypothetical protein